MSGNRRGPWLGGLIVAVVGAVWLIGQVIGAMIGLIGETLSGREPLAPAAASLSWPLPDVVVGLVVATQPMPGPGGRAVW